MEPQVAAIIEQCGGFRESVSAVVSFSRAFWDVCSRERALEGGAKKDIYRRDISPEQLQERFVAALENPALNHTFDVMLDRVEELKLGWLQKGKLTLRHSVANPLEFLRFMLDGARPDHEIRYFLMQNVRHYYRYVQSSAAAHQFQVLSVAMNNLIDGRSAGLADGRQITTWDLHGEIMPALTESLDRVTAIPLRVSDLFLECCRSINYLRLSWKKGCVEFHTASLDAEYLLSRLFGMPTAIKGLDDLFGGGGIMLVEASDTSIRDRIGGRAVVTVGPFGSAKSLLSLQMAVEVARKGGVAWVMPLEQTAEECLYTLESMGCLHDGAPLCVATTVPRALELLEQRAGERGALILLRTVKESLDDFLAAFEENVRLMKNYPLRLMVVDPVSAMAPDADAGIDKRGRMLQLFEALKQSGTNIWLVAEEGLPLDHMLYEQNIADTVIRLSSEYRHGYSQRYIEITKSRLQREQRGKHAFAVGPGRGITIYPSSAAVRSRMQMRSGRAPEVSIKFGLPSLDEILGEHALYAGDVIVLQGGSGCFKTPVGLSFLLSSDWGETDKSVKQRPLLVSARDDEETIRHALEQLNHVRWQQQGQRIRRPEDVRIVPIEGGYVKPGFILQRIESEFLQSRLNRRPIGRVMIDNVAHWDISCPYIREDETFGDTLIEVLRRHRVTTVLTCGASVPSESALQRSVLDNADCLIQFERIEYRGTSRVMVRVLKTRNMRHRRESFELLANAEALQVKTASSLVRVGRGGKVSLVKVRLFLHAESDAQTAYNKAILMAVRSILSPGARLASENPIHVSRALSLGPASAVDELQILQLDEFQLPIAGKPAENELHLFPASAWPEDQWGDIIPRLQERVRAGDQYTAVPFYENIGLLVYRSGVSQQCAGSWEQLSRECAQWEAEDHAPGEVFFDFPMVSDENYNVLFLEILLSLAGSPPDLRGQEAAPCVFREWLTSEDAVQANLIMHRLCRRVFNLRHEGGSRDLDQPAPFQVNVRARVWRHWYSTLNQMLAEMSATERAEIIVAPLPGNHSVAGEWFLGVPSYSAAPDVGLRVIQLYTNYEADLDRLKYGVGLPIRRSFYARQGDGRTTVSPFFSMDAPVLLEIIEGALRRSSFGCYRIYASMLSTHLRGVLMLSGSEPELGREIRGRIEALRQRLGSVAVPSCIRCSRHPTAKRAELVV